MKKRCMIRSVHRSYAIFAIALLALTSCVAAPIEPSGSGPKYECDGYERELQLLENDSLSLKEQRLLSVLLTRVECRELMIPIFRNAAQRNPQDLHQQQIYFQVLFYAEKYSNAIRQADCMLLADGPVQWKSQESPEWLLIKGVVAQIQGLAEISLHINEKRDSAINADRMEEVFRPALDNYDAILQKDSFGLTKHLLADAWKYHPSIEARVGMSLLAVKVGVEKWGEKITREAREKCLLNYSQTDCDQYFDESLNTWKEFRMWYPAVDRPVFDVLRE